MTRAASVGALALLALAACSPAPPDAADNRTTTPPSEVVVPEPPAEVNLGSAAAPLVQIAPDGLTITSAGGEAHQLSFGLTRDAVAAELGAPEAKGTARDCGAGPLEYARYPGGLSLSFQDGSFAGWTLDAGSYRSAEGIGIGSTRTQLEAAGPVTVMDQSTIGIEFTGSDFSGLLDSRAPAGKVTHLWAGITCIAR